MTHSQTRTALLWERNLVAIRAEAEYGWLVHDPEAFVKFDVSDND